MELSIESLHAEVRDMNHGYIMVQRTKYTNGLTMTTSVKQ